jgi:hypothetical protein
MGGLSFVTPVTGLSGPNTGKEDDDDDDDDVDVYVLHTNNSPPPSQRTNSTPSRGSPQFGYLWCKNIILGLY